VNIESNVRLIPLVSFSNFMLDFLPVLEVLDVETLRHAQHDTIKINQLRLTRIAQTIGNLKEAS
jgi:hypothetical protein